MSDFEILGFAVFVGLMGVAFTFFYVKIDKSLLQGVDLICVSFIFSK